MIISLPTAKVHKIPYCSHQLTIYQSITLRSLARLIGQLESSRPTIWRNRHHFWHLQMDLINGLQVNRKGHDSLTSPAFTDIYGIASHILERDNVSADTESRVFKDISERKFNPTAKQPFLQNRAICLQVA